MKFIPSLAVLAVLVACGPAPELKRRQFSSGPEMLKDGRVNLDNKTPAEVLKIKYNNDVRLECEFKAGRPDKLLSDLIPEKKSWVLEAGSNKAQTIEIDVEDRHLEVEISPVLSIFGKYNVPEKLGVSYKLEHTPVVDLTLRPMDNNIQKDVTSIRVFENILSESLVFNFDGMINLLSCSLNTVIAPKYEVEFQKVVREPEPVPETEPAPVVNDQPSQASENPSGQENGSSQDGPATGTH
jgi:hypothetical protein